MSRPVPGAKAGARDEDAEHAALRRCEGNSYRPEAERLIHERVARLRGKPLGASEMKKRSGLGNEDWNLD
jgi:hypothetical protein